MSQSSPMDTADAFGGVLVRDDGKILVREPKGHYGGYVWTFPKGRESLGVVEQDRYGACPRSGSDQCRCRAEGCGATQYAKQLIDSALATTNVT